MCRIKKGEIDVIKLIITVAMALIGAFIFAYIYKVILNISVSRCLEWDILKWAIATFGIFLLFSCILVYYYLSEKGIHKDTIVNIGLTITITLFLSFGVIQPIILDNCNRGVDYNLSSASYFANFVKPSIYIYDNETGHQNMTMIICNAEWENIRASVTFKLEFPKGFNISIRKTDNRNDMYYYENVNIYQEDNKRNTIEIVWEDPKIDEPLKGQHCLFANLSVTWNVGNKTYIPPDRIYFKIYNFDSFTIAKILNESPIRPVIKGDPTFESFREWYIEDILKDYYESREKEDWS